MIFFYHNNPFPTNSTGFWLLNEFFTAVGLFFVLSSLLISYRYLGRVELSARWLGRYFRQRLARIYPVYFLLTCAVILLYQLVPAYDLSGRYIPFSPTGRLLLLGFNFSLLRGLFSEFKLTALATGWSLTVEACFYVVAPLLLVGLRRHGPRWLLLCAAGLLVMGLGLVALPAPWHPYGFVDTYPFMLWSTFWGRCPEFLGGMYLAWLLLRASSQKLARPVYTTLGLAWVLLCLAAMAWLRVPSWPQSTALELTRIFFANLVIVPGFCCLLYGLVREPSSLRRLLSSRAFSLLGQASYAFFLLHACLPKEIMAQYLSHSLLLRFLLTNIAAIGLYLGFEKPVYQFIVKRAA
jgi:peptidoglycan/LPS O-acetylase OafA/YrhL